MPSTICSRQSAFVTSSQNAATRSLQLGGASIDDQTKKNVRRVLKRAGDGDGDREQDGGWREQLAWPRVDLHAGTR